MPSIRISQELIQGLDRSFKPYYNWNAFNTGIKRFKTNVVFVLNLIITGMPSIL